MGSLLSFADANAGGCDHIIIRDPRKCLHVRDTDGVLRDRPVLSEQRISIPAISSRMALRRETIASFCKGNGTHREGDRKDGRKAQSG